VRRRAEEGVKKMEGGLTLYDSSRRGEATFEYIIKEAMHEGGHTSSTSAGGKEKESKSIMRKAST